MNLVDPKDLLSASNGLSKFGGVSGAKILMRLLKLNKLNKIYNSIDEEKGISFIQKLLEALKVKFEIDENTLANIPKEGSFIVIANHPFGGIDGVLLLKILIKQRPDFKIMANFLLKKIEPMSDYIFAVNPFEGRPDIKSVSGIKKALEHIKNGGPLGIFPAGEVAAYQKGFQITDKKWSKSILRFIKKAEVPVLPIYFHGNNSQLFYLLGKVHPILRTIKLPSELFNKKNKTIKISIGTPISVKEQKHFSHDIELYGKYLRANTFTLANELRINDFYPKYKTLQNKESEDIIPPVCRNAIKNEIEGIAEKHLLYSNQRYDIYCSPSDKIPSIMREIGRLREVTFREVGEGTNKSIDLDEYDVYYNQLFIWDISNESIVGGYRIGKGKDIMQQYGINGFYLHSLFELKKKIRPLLTESLELGRSFVVKEYQKKIFPLFLLWKGILYMLLKNAEYRYLIGPASISNDYSESSKNLIVEFINRNYFDKKMGKRVKPRNKLTLTNSYDKILDTVGKNLNLLDSHIGRIEGKDAKLPILIRRYIEMNAKIIGFNKDPMFNDCLDSLILLDIYDIPDKIIHGLSEEINEQMLDKRFDKIKNEPSL